MLEDFDTAESAVLSDSPIAKICRTYEDNAHLKEDEQKDSVRS